MQPDLFSELFPLFNAANPETIQWLLSVATEHEYPAGRAVLMEDAWGNAVYFVNSGWVKVRRHVGDDFVTLAVLSRGDFFGEMAILDESPRSTDVVAMTAVKLLSISAQRFIQTLFKDPQLHHRMLQLMVQRLRQTNFRFQLRHHLPAVKLANTLASLQESYGEPTEAGIEIFNISLKDLADVTDITEDEASKIIVKLEEKNWLKVEHDRGVITLINIKQISNLAGQL